MCIVPLPSPVLEVLGAIMRKNEKGSIPIDSDSLLVVQRWNTFRGNNDSAIVFGWYPKEKKKGIRSVQHTSQTNCHLGCVSRALTVLCCNHNL